MNSPNTKIQVVPYDPQWPKMFAEEASSIRHALGGNCMNVYHIGSTSVPGLRSKPIIDIIVASINPAKAVMPMESIGYQYKGEYNIPFRYYFTKTSPLQFHVHMYKPENPEIELNLLFTNYLRAHPEVCAEYAQLKTDLLTRQAAHEKSNAGFTGYTLGKFDFIQQILQQAGFERLKMMHCTQEPEWTAAGLYRQKYFFDKLAIMDPYTWTFNHPEHVHFILYYGTSVCGYAHIQLWPQARAALRIIVINEPYRKQGLGIKFLGFCEQWLADKGYRTLHIEASPESLNFYIKQGYEPMDCMDPDGYERDPQDISIGKAL